MSTAWIVDVWRKKIPFTVDATQRKKFHCNHDLEQSSFGIEFWSFLMKKIPFTVDATQINRLFYNSIEESIFSTTTSNRVRSELFLNDLAYMMLDIGLKDVWWVPHRSGIIFFVMCVSIHFLSRIAHKIPFTLKCHPKDNKLEWQRKSFLMC